MLMSHSTIESRGPAAQSGRAPRLARGRKWRHERQGAAAGLNNAAAAGPERDVTGGKREDLGELESGVGGPGHLGPP